MGTLKLLSLAIACVLGVAASGAAGAQAEEPADLWAAEGGARIDAATRSAQELETGLGTITCDEVSGHAPYDGESAALTGEEIAYDSCTTHSILGEKPTTVAPEEGCHFIFTAGTYTPEALEGKDQSHGEAGT